MQRILLVCMGNICRSPLASAVMQAEVERLGLQGRVAIDSAGVSGGHAGEGADPRARQVALRRGYPAIVHERARRVSDEDFAHFDLILAMDQDNLTQLRRRSPPQHWHKLHLFLAFAGQGDLEVPDPYYGPNEGFDAVLSLCESACGAVLRRLLGPQVPGG